jgi:hypothetical protein
VELSFRIKFSLIRKLSGYEFPAISKWHNVGSNTKTEEKLMKYLQLLFLLFCLNGFAQIQTSPKLIKEKGDYIFKPAKTIFPLEIEKYSRKNIYSFDKENKNIGAEYQNSESQNSTKITVYIYPAESGTEGRLRNEYLKSLQSISDFTHAELAANQFAVKKEGEKYICNGFKAIIVSNKKIQNQLTLYECGTWFLKIRITSNELNSNEIDNIENKFLEVFNPTKLTETKLLNLKSDLIIAPAIGKDKAMFGAIMGSAFKKLEWANTNVSEKERVSGFPDIYLEMHIEAIKEFGNFEKENENTTNEVNKKYISDINKILKSGFLKEFILKQYNMVMRIPDNLKLDFDGYAKWEEENKTSIDLNKLYYLITYAKK